MLLKRRDPQFLEASFKEINPYLSRVCFANGYSRNEVNELIQQTWEQFFLNLDKFEGRSELRTFVCGILLNKIHEYRRLQKRFIFEEDTERFMNEAFTADGWWKNPPSDPSHLLECKQITAFVKDCLDHLTEQQKAAFLLKEIEDENSTRICNILGVTVTHLRVLLFRAKEKLRRCLDGKIQRGAL